MFSCSIIYHIAARCLLPVFASFSAEAKTYSLLASTKYQTEVPARRCEKILQMAVMPYSSVRSPNEKPTLGGFSLLLSLSLLHVHCLYLLILFHINLKEFLFRHIVRTISRITLSVALMCVVSDWLCNSIYVVGHGHCYRLVVLRFCCFGLNCSF